MTPVFRSQTAMFRFKNQQKKKPGNKHGQIHLCCCSRVTEQVSKWDCQIHQRLSWPSLSKINKNQPDSAPRSAQVLNFQCVRTAVCHPHFYPMWNMKWNNKKEPNHMPHLRNYQSKRWNTKPLFGTSAPSGARSQGKFEEMVAPKNCVLLKPCGDVS